MKPSSCEVECMGQGVGGETNGTPQTCGTPLVHQGWAFLRGELLGCAGVIKSLESRTPWW